jgi:hypothetical protein
MIDQLSAADFETLPEHRLSMVHGDKRIDFEVAGVRALPARSQRPAPPFALLLRDKGARTALAQGTFRYEHPVHGALDLFTVPVGPDGQGMCYEIIFN